MEKIIKLQSEQNFAEVANAGAFLNKLIDFNIPGNNGTFDLSKSYINLNMNVPPVDQAQGTVAAVDGSLPDDTALFCNEIVLKSGRGTGGDETYLCPCSQIVRNADLFSTNKGMVESIRRVNTLRNVLWNLESDVGQQHDGLDKFGTFQGRRGPGNLTSGLIQNIGFNCRTDGTPVTSLVGQGIGRDFRIPLSDLFGVGNAQWNSDVYGDTRIHLEVEPNLLDIQNLGGDELSSTFPQGGNDVPYAKCIDYTAAQAPVNATIGNQFTPLITVLEYKNGQLDLPFHVGQAVKVVYVVDGAAPAQGNHVIESIELLSAARAAALGFGAAGACLMNTRNSVFTVTAAAGSVITSLEVTALKGLNQQISINRAELVLSNMVGVEGQTPINYRTYTTEEIQGNGLTSVTEQVIIEPACQNLIVASCATSNNPPLKAWENYRIAINNVDQTGNRDVAYNKPLHKDRIMRFFQNRGQNIGNSSLTAIDTVSAQGDTNQQEFYPILETMPVTAMNKIVNLELQAAGGVESLVFFKEITKSI